MAVVQAMQNRYTLVVRRPFDADRPSLYPAVIGCDEAGRGPLCGPVVAAAVWFDPLFVPHALLAGLDDSKRLCAARRAELAVLIRAHAAIGVSAASAALIDGTDIRRASLRAMAHAVRKIGRDASVLVDGRDVLPGVASVAVVGGDGCVPQIAAASIIAKTLRDELMVRLALRIPGYGLERNCGYGTAAHLAALKSLGPTAHHRLSFRPVAAVVGTGSAIRPLRG